MTIEPNDLFDIVVLEQRYDELLGERWPVPVLPEPDELLSSWLHATTFANVISLPHFWKLFGLDNAPSLSRLDHDCPDWLTHWLIKREVLTQARATKLKLDARLLPLLLNVNRIPEQGGPEWLQFCPLCWQEDRRPYFRRCWRLATLIHCREHHIALRQHCQHCGYGVGIPYKVQLREVHFCRRCDKDLRDAPATKLAPPAERSSRSIDDVLLFELQTGMIERTALRAQLDSMPARVFGTRSVRLTAMGAHGRAALYEQIADDLHRVLPASGDEPAAPWRLHLLRNGGRAGRLIELSEAEYKQPYRAARPNGTRKDKIRNQAKATSLYDFVSTYAQFRERRGPLPL